MTVCIAAVCEENTPDAKIILATDTKVSGALGSSETMLKNRFLSPSWRCLTSGSDTDIIATVALLKKHFRKAAVDETNVVHVIRTALNERKSEKANELIQGKYAISYTEFLATGRSRLPDDLFRAATTEVELIRINADFIIVGHDSSKSALLVEANGRCEVAIKEDFVAIGEGGYLAQASLLNRSHSYVDAFAETLYAVYEAKRFAEGAPSVGRNTQLNVLHSNGLYEIVQLSGMTFLASQYEQLSRRKIPTLKIEPNFLIDLTKWKPPNET